jgi:phage/plasmid-associated DNA primase
VYAFIDEQCELNIRGREQRSLLYRAYRDWARESGRLPLSAVTFNDRLAHGRYADQVECTKIEGTYKWKGIILRYVNPW